MKRILLLGFILAICILALPQGVLADTKNQQVLVTATIPNVLEFTITNDVAWPTVGFGATDQTSSAPVMHVKSNVGWAVAIQDTGSAHSTNAGHLQQYSGTTWGGHFLTDPLYVSKASGAHTVGATVPLFTDVAFISGPSGTDFSSESITFAQHVTALDESVAPDYYQITVKFTITQT
jgi:hypothetical protein